MTLLITLSSIAAFLGIWLYTARYDYHLFKRVGARSYGHYRYNSNAEHLFGSFARSLFWPVWWIGLTIMAGRNGSGGLLCSVFMYIGRNVARWWNKDCAIPRHERKALEQSRRLETQATRIRELEAEKLRMERDHPELVWPGAKTL